MIKRRQGRNEKGVHDRSSCAFVCNLSQHVCACVCVQPHMFVEIEHAVVSAHVNAQLGEMNRSWFCCSRGSSRHTAETNTVSTNTRENTDEALWVVSRAAEFPQIKTL